MRQTARQQLKQSILLITNYLWLTIQQYLLILYVNTVCVLTNLGCSNANSQLKY